MPDVKISDLTQATPASGEDFLFENAAGVFRKAPAGQANGVPILNADGKLAASLGGNASTLAALDANTALTDKLAVNRFLADEAALQAVDTTSGVTDNEIAWTSDYGILWVYDAADSASAATHQVVAPTTGSGRWVARQFPTYGSNSNGSYQLFGDGTCVCWGSVSVSFSSVSAASAVWTFPYTGFTAVPIVLPALNAGGSLTTQEFFAAADPISATQATIYAQQYKGVSVTGTVTVAVEARGRWY